MHSLIHRKAPFSDPNTTPHNHHTLPHLPIHALPPRRPEPSHRPNNRTARCRQHPNARKQPSVPNRGDERLGNDRPDAGADVADEIVGGDARGGALGHEFREHGGGHGEDEHAADAEEEVGDELQEPGLLGLGFERGEWGSEGGFVSGVKVGGLTGTTQKMPFCAVQPYQIKAPG